MKKITIIILAIVAISFASCRKEKTYCGKITQKYLLHKNNGGVYNIVFFCDSLQKNVNVSVTADCYVNSTEGETTCFTLYDYQVGE